MRLYTDNAVRIYSRACALFANQHPTLKSVSLTMLSFVLSVPSFNLPMIPPCLFTTLRIYRKLSGLEKKPRWQRSRLQTLRVELK
jgi:hypothetical protein